MATTAIHRLTLDPMGKCSNAFFSETTNIIKAKLYMNVHWMVLSCGGGHLEFPIGIKKQKLCREPSNDHSWAVWFQLSKWKRFFSETTWIIETKLPRNDHWKVLYKFDVFYADRKSKMATTAIHRLTLDP
jgi:hypothetical protein